MLFFAVVIISGDRYQFSADSEQEKIDWIQVLQDASRITVKSCACSSNNVISNNLLNLDMIVTEVAYQCFCVSMSTCTVNSMKIAID